VNKGEPQNLPESQKGRSDLYSPVQYSRQGCECKCFLGL